MNRFNLFFVFIATLISTALMYITEPGRHDSTSKPTAPGAKNELLAPECESLHGVIIYL